MKQLLAEDIATTPLQVTLKTGLKCNFHTKYFVPNWLYENILCMKINQIMVLFLKYTSILGTTPAK